MRSCPSLPHSPEGEGQRSSGAVGADAVCRSDPTVTSTPSAHGCAGGWALVAVDTQMAGPSTAWNYLSNR